MAWEESINWSISKQTLRVYYILDTEREHNLAPAFRGLTVLQGDRYCNAVGYRLQMGEIQVMTGEGGKSTSQERLLKGL